MDARAPGLPVENPLPDLNRRLDTWAGEGLISRDEADRIRAFEASAAAPREGAPARTSPLTEALGYLGAALAVAAGGVVLVRVWDQLATPAHVAIPGLMWLALLALGWALRDAGQTGLVRLSSVARLLSTGSLAWCVADLAVEGFDMTGRWALLWSAAASTAYSAALYAWQPAALQQMALAGALVALAVGIVFGSGLAAGIAIWGLGVAWIELGRRHVLVPRDTAFMVGALAAMVGSTVVAGNSDGTAFWFAVATAAGLIGAAVALGHTPMLVLAAIGLFEATLGTVQHYMRGSAGAAVGLFVAGLAVLALALVVARIWPSGRARRRRGTGGPAPSV
jgi:hypothetical protein